MVWFQQTSDSMLERTLLPFVPNSISPNQVSWMRIASLPFIYLCLVMHFYWPGFILFGLSALTDALDGAMARTRDRVTETGKILDSVADRGLIGTVALVFIPNLFGWSVIAVGVVLEALNSLMAWRARILLGYNPGANGAGKIKMILQSFAFLFIFAVYAGAPRALLSYAYDLIMISFVFALIQAFLYPSRAPTSPAHGMSKSA